MRFLKLTTLLVNNWKLTVGFLRSDMMQLDSYSQHHFYSWRSKNAYKAIQLSSSLVDRRSVGTYQTISDKDNRKYMVCHTKLCSFHHHYPGHSITTTLLPRSNVVGVLAPWVFTGQAYCCWRTSVEAEDSYCSRHILHCLHTIHN